MIDPTEELLTGLRPATPPAELMARLRAARPARGAETEGSGFRVQGSGRRLSWRRVAWIGGLGAAAGWVAVSQWSVPRGDKTSIADSTVAASTLEESQIFLPVESTRTLVSLQPARVMQQPDQPPQRFMRAVWLDDVTAVGADTDAALHLRRTHETYVPVSSPIY